MKILIVEDNLLIAEDLAGFVEESGHQVMKTVASMDEALAALDYFDIDLALVDIMIKGEADGVDLAGHLQQRGQPFLYVTAHGDKATVDRAVETSPYGYILKPFNRAAIYSALEVAKNRIELNRDKSSDYFVLNHYKSKLKIPFSDILFFKASNNYVELQTTGKKHVFVSSLRKVEEQLPDKRFVRVHKSYLVNFDKVEGFEAARIMLAGRELPVGKTFLPSLREKFRSA